jgi:hypothetical protein
MGADEHRQTDRSRQPRQLLQTGPICVLTAHLVDDRDKKRTNYGIGYGEGQQQALDFTNFL